MSRGTVAMVVLLACTLLLTAATCGQAQGLTRLDENAMMKIVGGDGLCEEWVCEDKGYCVRKNPPCEPAAGICEEYKDHKKLEECKGVEYGDWEWCMTAIKLPTCCMKRYCYENPPTCTECDNCEAEWRKCTGTWSSCIHP